MMATEPQNLNYPPSAGDDKTVQEVDVVFLRIFAVLAFLASTLFVVAVPLCVVALVRNADVVGVFSLICAVAMSVGLIGTGIGLLRRVRRVRNAQRAQAQVKPPADGSDAAS